MRRITTPKGAAGVALRALGKYGEVRREDSNVSESVYVTISLEPEATVDGEPLEIRMRFSDHELPPTYGMRDHLWADLDCTVSEPRPLALHWARGIARVGEWINGWHCPSEVTAGLAHCDELVASWKQRQEKLQALQAADASRRDENQQLLEAHGCGHLTGASRKRKLRKLREGTDG